MQSTPIINILIGSFAISFGLLVLTGIILAIRLYNNKEYFEYCNLHKDDPITPDEEIGEGERE